MKVKIKPGFNFKEEPYGYFAEGSVVEDTQLGGHVEILKSWVSSGGAEVLEEDVKSQVSIETGIPKSSIPEPEPKEKLRKRKDESQ